jgi:hypothetical protein
MHYLTTVVFYKFPHFYGFSQYDTRKSIIRISQAWPTNFHSSTPLTPANDLEVRGIRALEEGNALAKYESNVRRYEKLINRLKTELREGHRIGLRERIHVLDGVLNDLLEKGI